jgi:hypothetical protein
MRTIAADPEHLRARIGITAVQMIVSGGGISLDLTRATVIVLAQSCGWIHRGC